MIKSTLKDGSPTLLKTLCCSSYKKDEASYITKKIILNNEAL